MKLEEYAKNVIELLAAQLKNYATACACYKSPQRVEDFAAGMRHGLNVVRTIIEQYSWAAKDCHQIVSSDDLLRVISDVLTGTRDLPEVGE